MLLNIQMGELRSGLGITAAVLSVSSSLLASSGVPLPLSQYQAGSETVNNALVTNGNFEQPGVAGPDATGWTPYNDAFLEPAMSVTPPINPSPVFGNFSAQAGLSNIQANDNYIQDVTLDQNTEYVLSGYIWSYGVPRPNSSSFGDLAGVELLHQDAGSSPVSVGAFIEPNLPNLPSGGNGADGAFVYQTFSGSLFPSGASLQVRSDPQQSVSGTRPSVMARWDNVAITPLNQFRAQVWTSSASGTWGDNAKWRNNEANLPSAVASFSNQTAPVTVTLDADKTVGVMQFDSTSSYTIAGTNKILLQKDFWDNGKSPVVLQVLRGSHTVSAPIQIGEPTSSDERVLKIDIAANSALTLSNSVTPTGTRQFQLVKLGTGRADLKAIRAKTVAINAGTLGLVAGPAGTPVLKTTALTLGATGKLDVRNGIGIVDYTGASPLATLAPKAVSGDIFASSASGNLIVGIVEASTIGTSIFGEPADATSVAIISTFRGDSNLDRDVDFDDLLILAQNYGSTTATLALGDNNYDAKVNFDDLLALAQNYNQVFALHGSAGTASPTGSFGGDWVLAQSLVPEPASLSVLASVSLLARRRR